MERLVPVQAVRRAADRRRAERPDRRRAADVRRRGGGGARDQCAASRGAVGSRLGLRGLAPGRARSFADTMIEALSARRMCGGAARRGRLSGLRLWLTHVSRFRSRSSRHMPRTSRRAPRTLPSERSPHKPGPLSSSSSAHPRMVVRCRRSYGTSAGTLACTQLGEVGLVARRGGLRTVGACRRPRHCVANTRGARAPMGLDLWPSDLMLMKGKSPSLDSCAERSRST